MADPVVRVGAGERAMGEDAGHRDGVVPDANVVRLTIDASRSFHASRSLFLQPGSPAGP
jgi:hypothetical protein